MIRDSAAIRALCWSWCQLYVFLIQVNFLHSTGVLLSAASRSLASELCHQRGKSLSPSVLIFTVLGRDSNWLGLGPMFNPGSIIATKISKCKKIATLIWITCYNIKRDGGKKLFPQMKEALFPEGRGAWLTNLLCCTITIWPFSSLPIFLTTKNTNASSENFWGKKFSYL